MKSILTASLLVFLSLGVLAQDKQPEKPEKKTESEQQESIEQAPPGNVKSAETFVPSEEVSEDLSVSFPIDI